MKEGVLHKIQNHWPQLKKQGQVIHYKKGQVLFYEGHLPYGIYVLKSGDLFFSRSEQKCVEEHWSQMVEDRVLGIENVLSQNPYLCTCKAKTDCDVIFISKAQFSSYLLEKSRGQ